MKICKMKIIVMKIKLMTVVLKTGYASSCEESLTASLTSSYKSHGLYAICGLLKFCKYNVKK